MSYEPQPGTIAFRAIEWLRHQDEGAEVTAAVICEELGIATDSFSTCMKGAVAAGLVRSRTIHGKGRLLFWSLGDGTPLPGPLDEEPPEPRPAAPAGPVPKGLLFPGTPADAPLPPAEPLPALKVPRLQRMKPGDLAALEDDPAPAASRDPEREEDFDYCLYRDGSLRIWGLQSNDDGSVCLSAQQLFEIRSRMAWMPAPAQRTEVQP